MIVNKDILDGTMVVNDEGTMVINSDSEGTMVINSDHETLRSGMGTMVINDDDDDDEEGTMKRRFIQIFKASLTSLVFTALQCFIQCFTFNLPL